MIRMPRSSGGSCAPPGPRARPGLVRVVWYASCITLGSGCLYTAPVVKMNRLPEIQVPGGYLPGDPPIEVLLGQEPFLEVIASDSDSQELTCFWIQEGTAAAFDDLCVREGALVHTVHQITFDPELDDTVIEAHIFDAEAGGGTEVDFHLSLAGGEL